MRSLRIEHLHLLTGTPLQNRVGEFYSLVQFLRLDPYCYYFCKAEGCDCKCREYRFDAEYRHCEYCGHSPLQHYSLFNRDIVNPIRKFGYVGAGRTGFITLKREVLEKVLLRRTKAGRAGAARGGVTPSGAAAPTGAPTLPRFLNENFFFGASRWRSERKVTSSSAVFALEAARVADGKKEAAAATSLWMDSIEAVHA